jgi:hypothetical protein
MYKKVKNYLLNPHLLNENWIKELRNDAEQFSWENMISEYDHILENLADLS